MLYVNVSMGTCISDQLKRANLAFWNRKVTEFSPLLYLSFYFLNECLRKRDNQGETHTDC